VPYFGIDKVLPIFISILKLAKVKSPWQRTTLLVSAITLHNIPKDWLLEFFCGVAAGIPEASIAGAVTLAIGLEFRIFRKELPCQCLCEEWE
jgi:ZIP family zinc transporter